MPRAASSRPPPKRRPAPNSTGWRKRKWPPLADLAAAQIAFAAAAGILGGAMNALAGGGTFATLPALIALGLPANIANATSNVALLPGSTASVWAFRNEIGPVGGISPRRLIAITLVSAIAGSVLLVLTPTRVFDILIPWLLLFATLVLAFGQRAADWLHASVTIGTRTQIAAQPPPSAHGGSFRAGRRDFAAAADRDHAGERDCRKRAAGADADARVRHIDSVAAAVRDAGARFRQARGGLAARARDDRHAHADRRADRAQRLWRLFRRRAGADDHRGLWAARRRRPARDVRATHADPRDLGRCRADRVRRDGAGSLAVGDPDAAGRGHRRLDRRTAGPAARSEEHKSELQ